jgi:ATPases with chaperone activity, ATP-binding subunit
LFKPEFLNRLDDIIVFYPLTLDEIKQIVDIIMKRIEKNASENNIEIELTEAAREYLAKTGYNPEYGARPLQRLIEKEVEDPIAVKILQGEIKEGSLIVVDYKEDTGIVFEIKEKIPSHG